MFLVVDESGGADLADQVQDVNVPHAQPPITVHLGRVRQ
jgi:hypothetical protein